MSMDRSPTHRVIDDLRTALGNDAVLTGEDIPPRNMSDATRKPATAPAALVLPRSTADVSATLAICHAAHHPVVTQGGMTGLAAGAHPGAGEIALSLEKMHGIIELDTESGTITVWAGTPLAKVQEAALDAGFICGIDLGARGSCTIGGNIATNAGGNQVLRYGMARRNLLGLEAVQADGTVLTSLNKMLKNNTGYDWTQLFVGSEGTLGVITKVVLGLHPPTGAVETVLVAVDSVTAATALLRSMENQFGAELLVFEGMWREFIDIAVDRVGLRPPFDTACEICVLLEVAPDGAGGAARLADALGDLMSAGIVSDALVAQSGEDAARFWAYRESVYEYSRFQTGFAGFDVSVPRPAMAEAVQDMRDAAATHWPRALNVIFGHIADCNLHLIVGPVDGTHQMSDDQKHRIEAEIYPIIGRHGGSFSAEHGIGRTKCEYLSLSRGPAEIALMRTLKSALDPHGILNPGRIL